MFNVIEHGQIRLLWWVLVHCWLSDPNTRYDGELGYEITYFFVTMQKKKRLSFVVVGCILGLSLVLFVGVWWVLFVIAVVCRINWNGYGQDEKVGILGVG